MPRVLIAAPQVFDTPQSLTKAFQRLGWEARTVNWGSALQQTLTDRLKRLMSPGAEWRLAVQRDFNRVIRQQLIPHVSQEKPGLLLLVNPHRLDNDVFYGLTRLSVPIVTWATDSLKRNPERGRRPRPASTLRSTHGLQVGFVGCRFQRLGFLRRGARHLGFAACTHVRRRSTVALMRQVSITAED